MPTAYLELERDCGDRLLYIEVEVEGDISRADPAVGIPGAYVEDITIRQPIGPQLALTREEAERAAEKLYEAWVEEEADARAGWAEERDDARGDW